MRLANILLAIGIMFTANNFVSAQNSAPTATKQNNDSDELYFVAPPANSKLPKFNSLELQEFWTAHNIKYYAPNSPQRAVYKYFDENNDGVLNQYEEQQMVASFEKIKLDCQKKQQIGTVPGENSPLNIQYQ